MVFEVRMLSSFPQLSIGVPITFGSVYHSSSTDCSALDGTGAVAPTLTVGQVGRTCEQDASSATETSVRMIALLFMGMGG